MPLISVVIPVFNASKFLDEAMESVINQTLSDIEIICVNDGSTDNSLEILEKYANQDARVKLIDKPNSGYGASVNRGFAESQGEFLAIFEPDDILDKCIYEKLYANAKKYNLDVVKCNFYNYWSLKNKKKRSGLIAKCAKTEPFAPKDNLKVFTCHASVWAAIYKKSFLNDNHIQFLETPGASFQDMSFNFKVLATAEKIMLMKEPMLCYRQDNPNSSINNPAKVYCVCDEYEEIEKYLNTYPERKKHFNSQKLVNEYRAYLWNLGRLSDELQPEFLARFSKDFTRYDSTGELDKEFFKSINKRDLKMLIEDKEKFFKRTCLRKRGWFG